jgi:nitrogenase molybdenum-iron protein alpha/beta subunit
VKNADAEAVAKALNEAAEKMDGFVVNAGGYVEPAESHEIEEMLDSIPDEVAEAL